MALNPYTLYNLYDKGIIECVPTDLLAPTPLAPMASMSNPYLDMAKQGGLYQNHGTQTDLFRSSAIQPPETVHTGSMSQAGGLNTFNGVGIGGANQNTTAGTFGFNNRIGAYNTSGGLNTFNGVGIGAQSNAGGMNVFGGFGDTKNNLINGYNKTVSIINNTPKVLLGLLGGAIGMGAVMMAFRRGKKPANPAKTGFWSHLNPKNWSWFNKK